MTIQTNVVRRGAVYYHRIAVPADLREQVGRREFWRSLGTKDATDARRRAVVAAQAAMSLFDAVRETSLTKEEIAAHVRRYYERELAIDAFERRSGGALERQDHAIRLDMLRRLEAEVRDHLARGEFVLAHDVADEIMGENAGRSTPAYQELAQGLLRARLEATRRMIERSSEGNFCGEPRDPLLLAPIAAPTPLSVAPRQTPPIPDLLDQFFQEKKGLVPKYVKEFRDSIDWFQEFFGREKPITAFTEQDMVYYKNALLRLPTNFRKHFKGATIREAIEFNKEAGRPTLSVPSINNKRMGNVDSFFEWCKNNKIIAANPARGIRVEAPRKGKRRKKRDPFTIEQLNTMIAAPLFTGCASSSRWKEPGSYLIRDHRFWLPLLALWTGGRQAELAQLLVDDVREIDDVLCIEITDDDSEDGEEHGKHLKNEESKRTVPVHPDLQRLGFLEYVGAQRTAGHTRLFPMCVMGADGSYSPFSKHFRRFLDSVGIAKRGRTVFHSFRHTFQDAMREAGLTDSVQDALAGRTSGHSRDDYGTGYKPPRLLMEIEKISFPGLNLSHLRQE